MSINEEDWKNFLKAEELHKFDGDPESDPYKSKYDERALLKGLFEKLKNLEAVEALEETAPSKNEDDLTRKAALTCVLFKLAVNYVDTEERSEGEKTLYDILNILKHKEMSPKVVSIFLAAENYLGYVYCSRSDYENSLIHLKKAEATFHSYKDSQKESPDSPPPWDVTAGLRLSCAFSPSDVMVETNEAKWAKFEKLHTYTLFYLAQLYKNLNEFATSAAYCQQTLERELEFRDYDPVDWSLNAATLSQYYIGKSDNFLQARHCLAAASAVIDDACMQLTKPEDKDGYEAKQEYEKQMDKIKRCKADVYRCFSKYGLILMESSREALMKCEDGVTSEACSIEQIKCSFEPIFNFDKIDVYEAEISVDLAKTFDEARQIFLKVQHWLNKSKEYYTFDDYASDYVEIIGDLSRAFKCLAFFETDVDRKCKMHKRRIDLLESTLKELNPQFYIFLCRQLMFELAETSNEMLDLKCEIADEREGGTPSTHRIAKINALAQQGVNYFQRFLDSYKDANDEMPQKFEMNAVRPVCLAHFYIGRLFGKFLTPDTRVKLVNCEISLKHYQWIVNYCEHADPSVTELMKGEYDVCKDMVSLYPVKMERIRTAGCLK